MSHSHQRIPFGVAERYDVAVIGAGPAGSVAAIAAARAGARTILVDEYGYPGGMASGANVPNIMGLDRGGRQIVGGIADEWVRRLDAAGLARLKIASKRAVDSEPIGDRPLLTPVTTSPDAIRVMYTRMLDEAGVDKLFYARFLGARTEGRRIIALAVDCAEGQGEIHADAVVDATGDAHVVHRAGGATRECPPEDAMTKTVILTVGGVEGFDGPAVEARFRSLAAAGRVPLPEQNVFMGYELAGAGRVQLNFTVAKGNALVSSELTRMDAELREQIFVAVEWFRKEFPAFRNCHLEASAGRIGVRAGRTIVGLEAIDEAYVMDNPGTSEPVALGIRYFGDHGLTSFRSRRHGLFEGPLPIPWRTLIPEGFDNVTVAGRCISIDPALVTCIRYMGQCMATGQAAGVTAALAAAAGRPATRLDYSAVRTVLLDQGAILV